MTLKEIISPFLNCFNIHQYMFRCPGFYKFDKKYSGCHSESCMKCWDRNFEFDE